MTLDLTRVQPQVQEMGQLLLRQAAARQAALPNAKKAYKELAAQDPATIVERIGEASRAWRGAQPLRDPLYATYPAQPPPEKWSVIAADGSQIYLDRHRALPYYLVNIGSIHVAYARTASPSTDSLPHIYYQESDLYDQAGRFVSPGLINAKRDLAELAEIARLAQDLKDEPTLALLDNTLLFRYGNQDPSASSGQAVEFLESYLREIGRLRACRSMLTGFIDRSASTDVLAMVSLVKWSSESNRFRELTDRDLMATYLPEGHRSAVFQLISPRLHNLQAQGFSVYFFYAHLGSSGNIARVEVPRWVAENDTMLAWVHAGLAKECEATGGYPYSLIRAHELALVSESEQRALDQWLTSMALSRGLRPQPSLKSTTKRWLGKPRRHQL